jgi:hypoxia up-regulated 1
MVEELLAMELKNIKANAEAAAGKGTDITDVVLTVPATYTAEEKRALEFAADLAGLRVLGLISDGLAVGLNYATSRTFPSITEGGAPEYHLVYDMGAGSTTATVLRFQGRTVKDIGKRNKTIQEVQVMSTKWKKNLGGDTWNQLIVDDMIAKFVETPKMKTLNVEPIHVRKNGKTVARLWKEAERMRQVLSANSQTSASLEGLFFEDVNFKYKLSRAEFEELAMVQASEVNVPLVDALDAAGISIEGLDSVILHGGAVRTPFVQKHLEAVAGGSSKIRTNVNADEAAVLGAAFKAAGLSPSFRVKEIRADDTPAFDVRLRWTADGRELVQKLFTQRSTVGAEKQVPFKDQEDFMFEFTQVVDDEDVPISEVQANNLTASATQLKEKYGCVPANISTKFTIRLSPIDGLPEVISGSVSCGIEATKEGGVMDNVKGLFGFGSKKTEDQEPLKDDSHSVEETTSPLHSATTSTLTSTSSSASTSKADKPAKPSSTTVTIPLSITTRPLGLNLPPPTDQLARIRTRLANLDSSDHARVRRAEALNTLEAFTYRARDYITDSDFIIHSSQKTRDTIEEQLSEASEWLYGDGIDAKISEFQDRLKALKNLVEPVLKRKDEASKRAGALKSLNEGLDQMEGMIKMVESSVEKAAEDAKQAEAEKAAAAAKAESSAPTETNIGTDPDASDDLDDDPYSSSTSSPSVSPSDTPPIISPYALSDLSALQSSYSSVQKWLGQKLTAQGKLGPYDDPAVLVKELEEKTKELQGVVREVVVKNIRLPGGNKKTKPPGGKGGKKGKGSKKGKSTSGSTTSGGEMTRKQTTASSSTTSVKDEL